MNERILTIADDFTGGNAVAAGFASLGYRAVTVMEDQFSTFTELPARFDAIVVSTGTRHSNSVDARGKVREVLARSGRPISVSLRVDSTLRGPIATSVHAALEVLREAAGRHAVAVCVLAHPKAGRHTINGRQFLDGVSLDETELAREALDPIASSDVLELMEFRGQRCGLIPLEVVTGDSDAFHSKLAEMATTHDVIVFDASESSHLSAIAMAVAGLTERVEVLAVDPGAFSVEWARVRSHRAGGPNPKRPILAVIGSASELTVAQIDQLALRRSTTAFTVDFDGSGGSQSARKPSSELITSPSGVVNHEIMVLSVARELDAGYRTATHAADRIARNLATTARDLMEEHNVGAVFCTGGDTTQALLSSLGAWGVDVEEEVFPLAVSGTLAGGPWDGLPIITKGGMVGDSDSILRCIAMLQTRMTEYHPTLPSTPVPASNHVEEPHE